MGCDKSNGNCQPCKDCQDVIPPVMPRCDVILPDGVFANAVVTVNGGCIVQIAEGEPLLYQPDPCCQVAGGGSSGNQGAGLKGDKGDPGRNATIAVGSVRTVAADQPARVINMGTTTNAIFDFEIPQ